MAGSHPYPAPGLRLGVTLRCGETEQFDPRRLILGNAAAQLEDLAVRALGGGNATLCHEVKVLPRVDVSLTRSEAERLHRRFRGG